MGAVIAAHTGAAHGTLTLAAEGLPVEVTTFRADGPYTGTTGARLGEGWAPAWLRILPGGTLPSTPWPWARKGR